MKEASLILQQQEPDEAEVHQCHVVCVCTGSLHALFY